MADEKNSRQKIIIIILVAAGIFLAWQVYGMFSGTPEEQQAAATASAPPPPPMPTPKPAEIPKPAPLTQREMELMQLQQETEAKYLAAVNELQMLRIQRDIADTNRAIAGAKLDTVNAQKAIVSLLTPEIDTNYASRLTGPAQGTPVNGEGAPPVIEVTYTVISVTEIQGRWGAVIGGSGKLYNVHVGDVLPNDNSKVISIDRGGVVLEKDGAKKTISLVPII